MPLSPGTRLGPYEVVALIGQGGMGQVYRATDTTLKRAVAIKVLPDDVADLRSFVQLAAQLAGNDLDGQGAPVFRAVLTGLMGIQGRCGDCRPYGRPTNRSAWPRP